MSETLAVGIREAASRIGVGEMLVKRLIRAGHLRSFRIGDRRLIEVEELRRFVAERRTAEPAR